MAKNKPSFFQRLTGAVDVDYDDMDADQFEEKQITPSARHHGEPETLLDEEEPEGQLTVDVFQTPDEIVIKAIVAGVRPDDLDVSISRDMVTIRGRREEAREVQEDNYFYRELYWGSFSRTIVLPEEIDVESATASERHGLMSIRLPKIDKKRQTKLKVKSG